MKTPAPHSTAAQRPASALLLFAAVFLGCGPRRAAFQAFEPDAGAPRAAVDAGTSIDADTSIDAGTSMDAGPEPDCERDDAGEAEPIGCSANLGCPSGRYCKSLILSTCEDGSFVSGEWPYWAPHCANDCSDGSCTCVSDADCPPPLLCDHGSCGPEARPPATYCPDSCAMTFGPQGTAFCLCMDGCPTLCSTTSECDAGEYCELSAGAGQCEDAKGVCRRDCSEENSCSPPGCESSYSCGCSADYECPPDGACVLVTDPYAGPSMQCQAKDAGR